MALTEKRNVIIFMSTLSSMYYDRLIGHLSAWFANLVQIEEWIEDGLKTSIKDYQTIFEEALVEQVVPPGNISPTKRLIKLRKCSCHFCPNFPLSTYVYSVNVDVDG